MNTVIERISDKAVKLTIEVDLATWQKALDDAFQIKVKEVKADGFRPGKLPKQSYLNRYGYQSLYEEALQFVFNETYPKAIRDNQVRVVDQPKLDLDFANLNPEEGFSYTAEVEVFPTFKLGNYRGLKVTPLSKEVTDEDIEKEIKQILSNKTENIIKDSPAKNGDTVVIDFEGFTDNVPFEGGKSENYPLELGSNSFIPGFEEQLIGLNAGDEKEINVTFPTNYHEPLAGKDAMFKVKVHEVKTQVEPEWTDELVEELEIADVKTVSEHRAYLKEQLTKNKLSEYDAHLEKALISELAKVTEIDIPQIMIDEATEDLKENVKKQAESYQIPFELYLQYMGLDQEAFDNEAIKIATSRLKEELMINELINLEKISVTPEEIEDEFVKIAKELKMELSKVKEALNEDQVIFQIERTKAIDLLKENAILD